MKTAGLCLLVLAWMALAYALGRIHEREKQDRAKLQGRRGAPYRAPDKPPEAPPPYHWPPRPANCNPPPPDGARPAPPPNPPPPVMPNAPHSHNPIKQRPPRPNIRP